MALPTDPGIPRVLLDRAGPLGEKHVGTPLMQCHCTRLIMSLDLQRKRSIRSHHSEDEFLVARESGLMPPPKRARSTTSAVSSLRSRKSQSLVSLNSTPIPSQPVQALQLAREMEMAQRENVKIQQEAERIRQLERRLVLEEKQIELAERRKKSGELYPRVDATSMRTCRECSETATARTDRELHYPTTHQRSLTLLICRNIADLLEYTADLLETS